MQSFIPTAPRPNLLDQKPGTRANLSTTSSSHKGQDYKLNPSSKTKAVKLLDL